MMKLGRLILFLVMMFSMFSSLLLADDKADWVHVGSLAGKLLGPPRDGKIRISLAHQFGEIDRDMALRAEAMRKKLL